jgi:hypothetical protein
MQGHVAFLMKDVVLFAVSFYLLKQDVERVLRSADSVTTAAAGSLKVNQLMNSPASDPGPAPTSCHPGEAAA